MYISTVSDPHSICYLNPDLAGINGPISTENRQENFINQQLKITEKPFLMMFFGAHIFFHNNNKRVGHVSVLKGLDPDSHPFQMLNLHSNES